MEKFKLVDRFCILYSTIIYLFPVPLDWLSSQWYVYVPTEVTGPGWFGGGGGRGVREEGAAVRVVSMPVGRGGRGRRGVGRDQVCY